MGPIGQLTNRDGTHNVHCYQCGEFISRTYVPISRAMCVICESAFNGIALTPEFIQQYRASKQTESNLAVSALALPAEQPVIQGFKRKTLFGNISGEVFGAIGKFLFAKKSDIKDKEGKPVPQEDLPSVQVAKSKRRGRIFSGISISDDKK